MSSSTQLLLDELQVDLGAPHRERQLLRVAATPNHELARSFQPRRAPGAVISSSARPLTRLAVDADQDVAGRSPACCGGRVVVHLDDARLEPRVR